MIGDMLQVTTDRQLAFKIGSWNVRILHQEG
jgi:hypothetical protein